MTKLRCLTTTVLVATIVGGTVLGVTGAVRACPTKLSDSAVSRSSSTFEVLGSDAVEPLQSLPSRLSVVEFGVAGVGLTSLGLLVAKLLYRLRYRSTSDSLETTLFDRPELGHPEIALVSLPKEALAFSELQRDKLLTRY